MDTSDNINTLTDNVSATSDGSLLAPKEVTAVPDTTPVTDTTDTSNPMADFIGTLDKDIQNNSAWSKFQSPQELARSYTELDKLVGRKSSVPADDAAPEEWNDFFSKIGRPEDVDGYGIKALEGLTGGDERLNAGLKLAYDAGLTKNQAETLFTGLMQSELADVTGMQQMQAESLKVEQTKLEDAWGNGFDEMVEAVTGFQKSLGIYDTFTEKGLNNDADLLLFMADVAKKFGESETINVASTHTVAGLDNAISELNSEMVAYVKRGEEPPQHMKAKKAELFAKRYN